MRQRARELQGRDACRRAQGWDTCFGQDLAMRQACLEITLEKISGGDSSAAGASPDLKLCIQREHHGWQFRGRVGMRKTTTDRAAVANGRVSDRAGSFHKQGETLRSQHITLQRCIARHCPYRQATVPLSYIGQFADLVEVD